MNKRIDYKVKALELKMLLLLVGRLVDSKTYNAEDLEREVLATMEECEAMSDDRLS